MANPSDFPATCPGCGCIYAIPLSMAGIPVTCEACQTDFLLPEPPCPGVESAPMPPLRAKARTEDAFLKNALLLLAGAGMVWGGSSYLKRHRAAQADGNPVADDQAVPVPEPVIYTSVSKRRLSGEPAAQPDASDSTRESTPAVSRPAPVASPPLPAVISDPPATGSASAPDKTPMATEMPVPAPLPTPSTADLIPLAGPEVAAAPVTTEVPALPVRAAADATTLRRNSRLTLERFLLADTLEERIAVTQNPNKIRALMEEHYRTHPIGPLPLEEIAFLTDSEVPDTKRKFHLYNVSLRDQEAAIPVAVEETKDGYRVDWQAFAESYTHRLKVFFATPAGAPGRFRVMLRRAHYFGPPVPGQDTVRLAYTVEPPTRDETFHAWVDKDSLVYKEKLARGERAGWDAESYVIVELAWRGDDTQGRWVALQRITADSWRAE